MRMASTVNLLIFAWLGSLFCGVAAGQELIPPASKIKPDHPRVFLRSKAAPHAISLDQIRSIPRDQPFDAMLRQLRSQDNASAHAMVWLLTGEQPAADKAVARMRAYRYPGNVDTFHIFFRLMEFGLAYDWLYNCPAFTDAIKAEVRQNVMPLVREAIKVSNDHMFHNYIWMSAGGAAIWTMATAGEDEASTRFFEQVRQRFNTGLFPAWRYLDGLPSEPMGYWSLYVFAPGVYTVLAAQSAFETDLVTPIRGQDNRWLDRHFENLIHSTLPDMRYIPWGDLQGGPNGGVTHEMAGIIDAATWALQSPQGRRFGQWIADKRGLSRFHGETAIFYMLYTRQLPSRIGEKAETPPLSYLAGNRQSGHFIARGSWADDATIVGFRCADHFGDHHHYDQGSFLIYRRGLLAVDPPVYRKVAGPQQKTENHNTLLIGGKPQRPARGQWFVTVEDFKRNLTAGRKLETGDILFHADAGEWAAVSGQFAQAYDCPELASCVRQMLFIRPGTVIIVDQLRAAPGKQLPKVSWLLQAPDRPTVENQSVFTSNGESWLRCRPVLPGKMDIGIEATPVNTHRIRFDYAGKDRMALVFVLETGEGTAPDPVADVNATPDGRNLRVSVGDRRFDFACDGDYPVRAAVDAQ